jgi:Peptidase C13 family
MRLRAKLCAFLVPVLLVVAPVGSGRAQIVDAKPPRGHVVALGLSDELNVFHSEATRAAAILTRHYGGGAAPLVYTNTRSSRRANAATLRAALATAASRMDRENDVLFVFLTSHGSPQGVSIKAGRREATLTPLQLAGLLRETGVRNKVLIISACYSGIFLPLADAGTLVITAADAIHPSFGCEPTATWTYFGRAFFNEAMPRTDNLRDAFVAARSAVLARERKQGYEPSNPQMAGGQGFSTRLRAAR